jgi:hypothetical protein
MTSVNWFDSDKRGNFAVNWGIPAALGELYNPLLTRLAATRSGTDEFVVQFSGIGATFPSLWRDGALSTMAPKLAGMMDAMGVSYLQLTDDAPMSVEQLTPFAKEEAIKGIFYSRYNYEEQNASIAWVEETPIIPARYYLSADSQQGSVDHIAESINSSSTNPNSEYAYSVIVVDATSGRDVTGYLNAGGNTMNAVAALIAALDENVDVVGADAFVARVKANLAPTLQSGDDDGK